MKLCYSDRARALMRDPEARAKLLQALTDRKPTVIEFIGPNGKRIRVVPTINEAMS